jgi:hypothetical protein
VVAAKNSGCCFGSAVATVAQVCGGFFATFCAFVCENCRYYTVALRL